MSNFLQSEEWAKVEEARGHRAVRLFDDALVFGFIHALPIVGNYMYVPRWTETESEKGRVEIAVLVEKARKLGAGWVRIEPETEERAENVRKVLNTPSSVLSLKSSGGMFVKAPHDMQPRENLIIDITKPEEALLASMKSKVRYNVRLAEKKGVKVFMTRAKEYQDVFCDLIEATAKRQNIIPHPRAHYMQIFAFLPESLCQLVVAEYEGEILAANLMIFCGDTATYLHGGTSDSHREVMAPIFLQWECIRESKRRGCTRYDFGGVHVHSNIKNSTSTIDTWAGITRFKTGFSPMTEPTCFPGCYDIIIDANRYRLYNRLRLLQRGLSVLKKFLRK